MYVKQVPEWGWIIGHGLNQDDVEDEWLAVQKNIAGSLVLVTILSVLGAAAAGRSIAKPVVELNKEMTKIAQGNLALTVTQQGRRDEIGAMARTMQSFLENLRRVSAVDAQRAETEKMKDEFISVVSHELRTPLTSIRGSLGLIMGTMAGQLSEQANQLISIAHKNSERLILLINDILDINKIESGNMRLDVQKESVTDLMQQAIESTKAYADKYLVRYEWAFPKPDIYINVDSARFVQVLMNFFSNAAKFSPGGAKVDIYAERRGDRVRVCTKDYGLGIPEEFQGRIFKKFSQADSSQTRSVGGSGLGLYICKKLVEQMGGTVGYATRRGMGTEFWAEFPIAEEESDEKAAPARLSVGPRGRPVVLYLGNDDAFYEELAKRLGKERGLTRPQTQAEAEALLSGEAVSLVVLHLEGNDEERIGFVNRIPFLAKKIVPVIVIGDGPVPEALRTQAAEVLLGRHMAQIVEEIRQQTI